MEDTALDGFGCPARQGSTRMRLYSGSTFLTKTQNLQFYSPFSNQYSSLSLFHEKKYKLPTKLKCTQFISHIYMHVCVHIYWPKYHLYPLFCVCLYIMYSPLSLSYSTKEVFSIAIHKTSVTVVELEGEGRVPPTSGINEVFKQGK